MPVFVYLLAFTIPLSIAFSFHQRGDGSSFALIYAFGILPLFELIFPVITKNQTETNLKETSPLIYDALLRLMVPIQLGLLFWFFQLMNEPGLTMAEKIGLTSSMGIGCGVLGINVAHELGHRKRRLDRILARLLLSTSLYWQFYIEHNRGHHKNVSTPNDPESSHLNESIYAFWIRSIRDTWKSSFQLDRNEMILAVAVQLLILILIAFMGGIFPLLGFMGAALIGILLLQSVNYIEHYGLSRKEMAPGQFEKVKPSHSWNADHLLSRAILFDLSRHSDHHAFVTRKYFELRHHPESPQMPTGYPGMILLALVPPLWFRIMNARIRTLVTD